MKIHDEHKRTGHLLSFTCQTRPEDNFTFFFPIEGLDQFDDLLKLIAGFQLCAEAIADRYHFSHSSISDIGRLEDLFPEADRARVLRFEPSQFLDKEGFFVAEFARAVLDRQAAGTVPVLPLLFTGGKATGANFFDREKELQNIYDLIAQGKNLLLHAPRRFGKSSLLTRLVAAPPPGGQACYIDLEGGKSPKDFIITILKALLQRKEFCTLLPLRFAEAHEMSESDRREILKDEEREIAGDWRQYTEKLFAILAGAPFRCILILDEFPWLIEDMIELHPEKDNTARDFLNWFASARQQAAGPTFILSGSEHLPSFLESHGLAEHMKDLEPIRLGLFEQDAARTFSFLALAGRNIMATKEEVDHILTLLGRPTPYFLQLFLDFLAEQCWAGETLGPKDIERHYYQNLLGSARTRAFESISLQLERYHRFGPYHRNGAAAVLDLLARKEQADKAEVKEAWLSIAGTSSAGFETMLAVLRDDFYVEEADGKLFMSSKLLREWWHRHEAVDL